MMRGVAGALPLLRYDLRLWRGGALTDKEHAVESPIRLTDEAAAARRLLELVPSLPLATWGRDELGVGDVWTSNSVVSWLLIRAGIWTSELRPPPGGRAPGWNAGLRACGLRS